MTEPKPPEPTAAAGRAEVKRSETEASLVRIPPARQKIRRASVKKENLTMQARVAVAVDEFWIRPLH
jgi:hypothetical protein